MSGKAPNIKSETQATGSKIVANEGGPAHAAPLEPEVVTGEEAEKLLRLSGADIYALLARAGKTRERHHRDKQIAFCVIVNAKSGQCPENCAFCSQSSHHKTGSPSYSLLSVDEIIARAVKAKSMGARAFSIVTSGDRLQKPQEIDTVCKAFEHISEDIGLECCASLGRVDFPVLSRMRESGLVRYHHNLETARSHFPKICSSYDYDESIDTIQSAHSAGLEVCSGGIFGMGESLEQRIELAETLRDLLVESIAMNFLDPRPGTPLADQPLMLPTQALKVVAVYRLMMPDRDILIAGGRQAVLASAQSMIFMAGANAMMVGDYLTTANRGWEEDRQMVRDQGFTLRPPRFPPSVTAPLSRRKAGRLKDEKQRNGRLSFKRIVKEDYNEQIANRLELLGRERLLRNLILADPERQNSLNISVRNGSKISKAVNFCSNDYLGFAASGKLNAVLAHAAETQGVGAGASRLIGGTRSVHENFERQVADFVNKEAALLFPSGYQANLGAITTLGEVFPEIISDSLNHASLVDGCRLSKSKVSIIPHLNLERLEACLRGSKSTPLVIIEGLYSMEGAAYDFRGLSELKKIYQFFLMVDEAHGLGVYGPEGKGVAAREGALDMVDVYMGTLGKACGLSGAFVASTQKVIELMVNRARSFIFTTAMAPALAAAASEALAAVRNADEPRRILKSRVRTFRKALNEKSVACMGESYSAIAPVMISETQATIDASNALLDRGFFVQAIRPPSVPTGKSRLRISLSALHEEEDVVALAAAIAEVVGSG